MLTDPLLRSHLMFLRRVVAPVPPAAYDGVEVVVLSHLHHDHCDLPSLARIPGDPWILVPSGGEKFLNGKGFGKVVSLVAEHMMRASPSVYCDFVDYDEIAYHAGPARAESIASLKGIDRILGTLERLAPNAPRPYHFVVLSDHGQS